MKNWHIELMLEDELSNQIKSYKKLTGEEGEDLLIRLLKEYFYISKEAVSIYGEKYREIGRVKDFENGDSKCIICEKPFHLYWNGGELDDHRCCGLYYSTQHQNTDLIIYKKENEK